MNNQQEPKNTSTGGDEWGLEVRTGIGNRVDEQRAIKLRRWWKWFGIFTVIPLLIIALVVKFVVNNNVIVDVILAVAFVIFVIAESKYVSLKNRSKL